MEFQETNKVEGEFDVRMEYAPVNRLILRSHLILLLELVSIDVHVIMRGCALC